MFRSQSQQYIDDMIVTLIHGTWARDAAWTSEGSAIRNSIQTAFEDVRFLLFSWNAANSHRARLKASGLLQDHIRSCNELYPEHEHFLVAHSHAGNVALYALCDKKISDCIKGIICLSTPFIHCRRRNLGQAGLRPIVQLGALGIMFMVAGGGGTVLPSLGRGWKFALGGLLYAALAICYVAYFDSLLQIFTGATSVYDLLETVERSFNFPRLDAQFILVIRAPGDEASGALNTSHFLSEILTGVSRLMNRLSNIGSWFSTSNGEASVRWLKGVALCLLGLFAGYLVYALHDLTMTGIVSRRITLSLVLPILGGLALFVSQIEAEVAGTLVLGAVGVILLPILLLLAISTSPYGIDTALLSPIFEISAESTPPGRVNIFEVAEGATDGLWHSSSYSSPLALEEILSWLSSRRRPAPALD